ncbi:hypothetical protein NPIL_103621 [Nephila pilipes]|uniref:Uncharacterized protein n=1 Tax=Nephila pilipes TaxID=299642 RepID=A0A8X6Q3Z1_NEPPI|nr:hypothetical protein NPIL_103621 [Nephila pilipes]
MPTLSLDEPQRRRFPRSFSANNRTRTNLVSQFSSFISVLATKRYFAEIFQLCMLKRHVWLGDGKIRYKEVLVVDMKQWAQTQACSHPFPKQIRSLFSVGFYYRFHFVPLFDHPIYQANLIGAQPILKRQSTNFLIIWTPMTIAYLYCVVNDGTTTMMKSFDMFRSMATTNMFLMTANSVVFVFKLSENRALSGIQPVCTILPFLIRLAL